MRNAAGLDISKDTIDVAVIIGDSVQIKKYRNDETGIKQIQSWLQTFEDLTVCMEATGNYYEAAADYLAESFIVHVVNPLKISKYAESRFARTKTDKQDAKLIAEYCQTAKEKDLIHRPKPTEAQYKLARLTAAYAQISQECTAMKNRHEAAKDSEVRAIFKNIIRHLQTQLKTLKTQIQKQTQTPQYQPQIKRLETIPAIGRLTAAVLLQYLTTADFPTPNKFAAFAGLSPQQKQSGTSVKGKEKITRYGNRKLRTALFMPAMVAYRMKAFPAFISRLEAKNKPKKVIIGAIMRKLAVIAYHVHTKGEDYDPTRYAGA
ncbi:transposase [Neisseria sp. HMSC065D04]|uniref:IS110 family transposase n=1 Tax=Neisseria sp. HMSC065D04 TaxID=1739542 RepID=UPI0008A1922D|nr:IS110 family transposase [Neisseria sp. HMSC065D04]OFO29761.1 transposase [Neisseria sp. HMSC065D04]